ncbi:MULTISPECIES: DNA-methyltransferase [Vibrio]|uniref:Methyltransferase n=1 Tax=Vibrio parahaemolyticus TaxID=670 RepID=A0A0C5GSR8_VIBPH|nr:MULTISPECIES: site-specific DNA-methyltransferase [Vibrio]AJP18407.1 DNA methylase [Vibrio parahaemolyticus]WHR54465.1 site-specific DNA-methyltransferase [Vibrio furnissii]WQE79381.1 site-specific DNA-methyltransferase [Vibrio alfacsensis]
MANKNKKGLHEAMGEVKLVAYSTNLGIAIWGNSKKVFTELGEPIHLCVTSPPYPLKIERGYGNVSEQAWVDFITESLEPIVENLVPGGSVVLNVSNDIFESKRPSRSTYLERMVLALNDRLGLSLMDRWPWINTSKPPAPTQWACVNRMQLCSAWEPVYWFTNDPDRVRSDNRRVLVEHTEQHKKLLEQGGDSRIATYGDGAYRLRGNAFSNKTQGKIPKNIIQRGHRCADTSAVRKIAKELGLPPHPAMFPTDIPSFAIEFLTNEDELVVDLFSGSNKTGLAAERAGRRWVACDLILEYVRTQAELFSSFAGFWMNPALACVGRSVK